MAELKDAFSEVLRPHMDNALITSCWDEIRQHHSTGRHYHTLEHLEHIHRCLGQVNDVQDRDALVLATAYHDIIQNMVRGDDERRSAGRMLERLRPAGVPERTLLCARKHILATEDHQHSGDPDTDLFTDADLAILGSSSGEYARYAEQIRREYPLIPDVVYALGRKKFLKKLLDRPAVFKTPAFLHLEEQARTNMTWEAGRL